MIKLTDLLEAEKAFTATSKETGNVSVFKTKAARDAAVKAGNPFSPFNKNLFVKMTSYGCNRN